MRRPPSFNGFIYFLFVFLTLGFIGLVFVSLSLAYPCITKIPGIASHGPEVLTPLAGSITNPDEQAPSEQQGGRLEIPIRKELASLANYDVFDNINFSIDINNVVTLLGQVRSPYLKASVEKALNSIKGVRSVIDQLELLPTSPLDDRIRRATFFKIYWEARLRPYLTGTPSIHVIVKNGNLNLEGIVATDADRALAGMRANQVFNVSKVINNLKVANSSDSKAVHEIARGNL